MVLLATFLTCLGLSSLEGEGGMAMEPYRAATGLLATAVAPRAGRGMLLVKPEQLVGDIVAMLRIFKETTVS